VGCGTLFELYLPTSGHDGGTDAQDLAVVAPSVPDAGDHVLFIDDEPLLVVLAERALPRFGYRVTAFTDARAAIDAFVADPASFDICVTDMNMPTLSGLVVATELKRARPDFPVVLLSGYMAADISAQAEQIGMAEVLGKPIEMGALSDVLQRLLHGAPGGQPVEG
jgi:DNA-binding NtrC family response regulator